MHSSSNVAGRLVRSMTGHLGVATSAGGGVLPEEARLELQWVLALLERRPWIVISLLPCRESVVLISDAAKSALKVQQSVVPCAGGSSRKGSNHGGRHAE